MAESAQPVPSAASDTSFFGHPRGLATLFFTEFWERFSYYGMRALLYLFMTATVAAGGLGFDDRRAGAVYGLYTAAVYLLALPGGWIADRLLGQRRSVLLGGAIIALGHFSMAIDNINTFFLGLILIVLGTGLLKPNISTMVGELYPEGGARRDAGFSVFYMGINLGAFVAPLVCSPLGEKVNWHFGFAAAGIGMVFGLVQYVLGSRHLGDAGLRPTGSGDAASQRNAKRFLVGGLVVTALLVALIWSGAVAVDIAKVADATGFGILAIAVIYVLFQLIAGGLDWAERKRVVVIFILFLFSALFWAGFEQAGSSLNKFARDLTDRQIFGLEIPAGVLQSVNPVMIILFAPVFAALWVWLSKRRREPSAPAKFSIGLVLVGFGFSVMVAAALASASGKVTMLFLVATYFFHTCGELCLSPVGLSTVTKLAPHRMVSSMMGIWFMSISLGNLVAGQVAGRSAQWPLHQIFGLVAATTVIAGVILALLIRPIRRLMGGVH